MPLDTYLLLAILFFALFFIFLVLFLYQKDQKNSALKLVEQLQERLEFQELENAELQEQLHALQIQKAVLQSKYESDLHASNEKLQLLHNAKEALKQEFQSLSEKIYEHKTQQFTHTSKEHLELLLQPFKEQLEHFSQRSQEQFEVELKERYHLKNELKRLEELNKQLSEDAINLTKALKGESKTQGDWGEMILQRILEDSGLQEGREYEIQTTYKAKDQKNYRPDIIIHMPQNRDIVIDSKVSLRAYERYLNSKDAEKKELYLKQHLKSISEHIKQLSAKEYHKLPGIQSLDFVLLFIPIEGAFMVALQHNKEFFKVAYEQNILVVSPSTLLVTLRTIEHIWRVQKQEQHAKKIAQEAEAMYDKFVLFVEDMQQLGEMLLKGQDRYEKAMNKLTLGKGNLIKRASHLKELGLRPKKEIPTALLKDDYED